MYDCRSEAQANNGLSDRAADVASAQQRSAGRLHCPTLEFEEVLVSVLVKRGQIMDIHELHIACPMPDALLPDDWHARLGSSPQGALWPFCCGPVISWRVSSVNTRHVT